jgi:hypothetical protein
MPLVSDNVKKINNTIYEPRDFDFKDPKKADKVFNMTDFLGYKGLTNDVHAYLAMKNGWYSELVLMRGHGVKNMTYSLSNDLVTDAGDFFRGLPAGTSISFFAYSFRVNTQAQQNDWLRNRKRVEAQLIKATDPHRVKQLKRRLVMIDDELKVQKRAELRLWNREYLMEIFGRTKGALENLMKTIKSASERGMAPFKFDELTREEKTKRLYTLNNPAGYLAARNNKQ